MVRYLSWLANAALFAVACFLVANTANTVLAAWMAPAPAAVAAEARTAAAPQRDFTVILDRNIFNASLLAPATPPAEQAEDLEATKLPLQLLGTVAGSRPEQSWAAVLHKTRRETLVLRPGDPVPDGAEVVRIERRRIVLLEKGAHRELALEEPGNGNGVAVSRPQPPPPAATNRARPNTARRARQLPRDRSEVPGQADVVRSPSSIFREAQFHPRYEDGQMVGMQLNAIRPDSIFAEMGIKSGEVISEVNGIVIDSPESTAEIISEFSEAEELTIVVEDDDGPRTLTYRPDRSDR